MSEKGNQQILGYSDGHHTVRLGSGSKMDFFNTEVPPQLELQTMCFTFTKKVKSYVSEESLKDLVRAGVLQSYELRHSAEGSEVTLSFALDGER